MIDSYNLSSNCHSDTICYRSDQPTYANELQLTFYNNEIIKMCQSTDNKSISNDINKPIDYVISESDDSIKHVKAATIIQRAYRSFRRRRRKSIPTIENDLDETNNYIEFLGECDDSRRSGYSLITTSNSASESKNSDFEHDDEEEEIEEENNIDSENHYHNDHIYDSIPYDLSSPSPPQSPNKQPIIINTSHQYHCPQSIKQQYRKHSQQIDRPHLAHLLTSHRLSEQHTAHSVVVCQEDLMTTPSSINQNMFVIKSRQQQPLFVSIGGESRASRSGPPLPNSNNNCLRIVSANNGNRCYQAYSDFGNHRLSDDINRQSLQQKQARIIHNQKIITAKRMYRIGLNVFNKNPAAGINYLIKYQHIKAHPSHIAKFLLTKSGISRNAIGDYIGSISDPLALQVTKFFLRRINMKNKEVDEALRSFIYYVHLPGESQKICHLMEEFKEAYIQQSSLKSQFKCVDTIMILSYAIIMLQTDAHNQSIRKSEKMTLDQFVTNLRGVDENSDIERGILESIYGRVTNQEMKTQPDHSDQVRRLNDVISGPTKPPDLVNRIRRFMCYCRLSEIVDDTKKNKSDAHQREVFLFNDILLITKSHNKSRKEDVQYQCKYALDLADLRVKLFRTTNYLFGIQIFDRKTNESKLKLNAQCEQDQKKFIFDLSDCIFESLEMLKITYSDYLSPQSSQPQNSPKDSANNLACKNLHTFNEGMDHLIPNPPRRQESLVRNDRPDVVQSMCRVRNKSVTENDDDRLKAYASKSNSNNLCL